MNLFGVMDVTGSALKAERVRAEVVAANMANAETTRTEDGGPYRRQHVVFSAADGSTGSFGGAMQSAGMISSGAAGQIPLFTPWQMTGQMALPFGGGVKAAGVQVSGVVQDQSAPLERYDPGHPDADANGYVAYPDINPLTEMVDLMGATRAYGMNASALQAEKNMISSSLEILK